MTINDRIAFPSHPRGAPADFLGNHSIFWATGLFWAKPEV
jgi:hypothetical protein